MRASKLLAMAMAAATAGQTLAGEPTPFDVALDNRDFVGAAEAIDKLPDKERTKDVLDAYYGRFFAAAAQGQIAEPYLVRAIAAGGNRADRDQLAFELARTREVDGFVANAEADYRQLTATGIDPAVRRDATLSLARLLLGSAPDQAVALLAPLADDAASGPARWEAYLLLSRAYAIQGRPAEAQAALAAAWQEAPQAPVPADAIAVTAMDMGLDRAAANDRAGEVGLMSTGRTSSYFAGVSQIPVCTEALRPEDTVTVAIQADSRQRPIYSAVRASRPGIAQLFTVPLAVARQYIDGPATYVTLRCRSAPDANMRFAGGAMRDLSSWLAEKGYYPPLRPTDPADGDPLTQLKEQLRTLEAGAGPDSPVLVPALLQTAMLQGMQSRRGNAATFAEAKAIADRAVHILTGAGAPAEVLEQVRVQTTLLLAQNPNIADVAGPAASEAMEAMVSRPETTPPQALAAFAGMGSWQLRPAQRLALADKLIAFLDARKVGATDPIRQAAELRRASALREIGAVQGMGERLAAAGIAGDLCSAADRGPSIPPAAITITSDDYPKDLLRGKITGSTVIELSVDAGGTIEEQRMIVSQPPGLFDATTADKLKPVTLFPARRTDQPVACRGMVQTVRWQMPFGTDYSSPFADFSLPED